MSLSYVYGLATDEGNFLTPFSAKVSCAAVRGDFLIATKDADCLDSSLLDVNLSPGLAGTLRDLNPGCAHVRHPGDCLQRCLDLKRRAAASFRRDRS